VVRGSRWVDYDTHELLQMISELEDERRWARLREGVWIAILVHLALLSALTWIPKYVFKVPQVVDPDRRAQSAQGFYLSGYAVYVAAQGDHRQAASAAAADRQADAGGDEAGRRRPRRPRASPPRRACTAPPPPSAQPAVAA
jgi:predicted tellurium resistance membrane protein TerC